MDFVVAFFWGFRGVVRGVWVVLVGLEVGSGGDEWAL